MKITIDLNPNELKQLLEQFNGVPPVGGAVDSGPASPSATREGDAWETEMRDIHEGNLRELMRQLATYPQGRKPLHLINQVAAEEDAMRQYCG